MSCEARAHEGHVSGLRTVALLGLAGTACAAALLVTLPHAREAAEVFSAQDDPAALSDIQMRRLIARGYGSADITGAIDDALKADDADLARSYLDVAMAHGITVPDGLAARVDDAVAAETSPARIATRFATGFVTGQADDAASLTGTVAGDLFVFGDVRDVIREGKHLVAGEEADHLILGLAATGLAVTAATYVSVGGAAPVRTGLSLVKDARKIGRLGEGLSAWVARSARGVVDAPALRNAMTTASVTRPAQTVDAVKAAFKVEKAGGLVRLGKDAGRLSGKLGVRGTFDALKIAESPKDVTRAVRLAESKGSQTRALFKILGRGAILLAAGTFQLAWWLFGALMALVSFVIWIKATTERLTQAVLDRRKADRRVASPSHASIPVAAGLST